MPYEVVSRALATISCLFTFSLFATTMAIAAIGVENSRMNQGATLAAKAAKSRDAANPGVVVVAWSKKF